MGRRQESEGRELTDLDPMVEDEVGFYNSVGEENVARQLR